MALTSCPECNHEISTKAKVCFTCGAKNSRHIGWGDYFQLIFALAVLWFVLPKLYNSLKPFLNQSTETAATVLPEQTREHCKKMAQVMGGLASSESACLETESEAQDRVETLTIPDKIKSHCEKVTGGSYAALDECIRIELAAKKNVDGYTITK